MRWWMLNSFHSICKSNLYAVHLKLTRWDMSVTSPLNWKTKTKPPKQWMNEHKWDKTSSSLLLAPMTCEAGPLLSWASKEPTGKHIHWVLGLEWVFFCNVCPVITWTHDKSRNCTTALLLALHFLKKINTKLWAKHTAFRISLNLFFFSLTYSPKKVICFFFFSFLNGEMLRI